MGLKLAKKRRAGQAKHLTRRGWAKPNEEIHRYVEYGVLSNRITHTFLAILGVFKHWLGSVGLAGSERLCGSCRKSCMCFRGAALLFGLVSVSDSDLLSPVQAIVDHHASDIES